MLSPRRRLANELGRYLESRAREARDRHAASVLQVYVAKHGHPDPVGSCVALHAAGRYFVVTAAHVLDHGSRGYLYAGSTSAIEPLPESGFITPIPAGRNREEDSIDIGLFEYPSGPPASFAKVHWIDLAELDVSSPIPNSTPLMVLGYPYRRTRVQRTRKQVASQLNSVTGFVDSDAVRRLSLVPTIHVAVSYPRKRMRSDGRRMTGPLLHGVSGGGVFRVLDTREPTGRFVGVVTESRTGTDNVIIATNALTIRAMLLEKWPELRAEVGHGA